jgi:hypothetical protein
LLVEGWEWEREYGAKRVHSGGATGGLSAKIGEDVLVITYRCTDHCWRFTLSRWKAWDFLSAELASVCSDFCHSLFYTNASRYSFVRFSPRLGLHYRPKSLLLPFGSPTAFLLSQQSSIRMLFDV